MIGQRAESMEHGAESIGQRAWGRGQRGQKSEVGMGNADCGLRPVGAIGAYATEGMWNGEFGSGNEEVGNL